MVYQYFVTFNWVCGILGFWKPLKNSSNNKCFIVFNKLWSVLLISGMVANYMASQNSVRVFDVKRNLQQFAILNQLLCNIAILFIETTRNKDELSTMYQTVTNSLESFKVSRYNLKYIALKLHFWVSIPTCLFLATVIREISVTREPPFVLLIAVPCFITILHLLINLYLILALLKLVNRCLSNTFLFCDDLKTSEATPWNKFRASLYMLDINACFIDYAQINLRVDVQFLCRIYDDLSTCMKLLEKYHGLQILLGIWLMFSNAVFGIPLVTSNQATYPSIIIINAGLTFSWFIMVCFIQDQIQKEVEKTDNLIIKHLIDFRCDKPRKSMLQSFKQLVSTERLNFTSCSLFHLSYSMIVGTVLNVLTYSIILIQLVVSK